MSECAVYRMYDEAGVLLWVGMSINVPQRLVSHRSKAWWPEVARIDVKHFAGRKAAAAAEEEAIATEAPRHNVDPGRSVAADTVAQLRDARPSSKGLTRRGLLRYERGLTAERVTQAAGISPKTLRGFEHGGDVSAPIVKRLADFYGITVAELLGVETDREAAA